MKIQDVERHTGLDRATIRFYEKEGLVMPVRQENGYRSYSEENVSLLLKIKLLRQLGVSLTKIKNLQQGSESFTAVLSQQIETLSQQIQNDTAAKQVCIAMRQDGVQFSSLDSARYLDLLAAKNSDTKPTFQERISRERHPWRRYFARSIDYALVAAVLSCLIVVVFRIRPFSTDALRALNYLAYLLAIPATALMLHFWGTTPGKWAMGIRIEHISGGNLRLTDALRREASVFCLGEGLSIPVVSWWRLYKSYKNDAEGEGNPWNADTEIQYTNWGVVRKASIGLLIVGSFALSMFSSLDTILPKYRGEGITLSEFVRNYCDYEKTLERQGQYVLSEEGLWIKKDRNGQVIVIFGDPEHIRPDFTYEFSDDGFLTAIQYSDSWDDAHFQSPVPSYCTTALYALLGSRPGSSQQDLVMAEELIVSEIHDQLIEASEQGSFTGEFMVNDVKVSWNISAENCDFVSDTGWMVSLGEDGIPYSIDFRIEIIA